jgi:hypothetical protein
MYSICIDRDSERYLVFFARTLKGLKGNHYNIKERSRVTEKEIESREIQRTKINKVSTMSGKYESNHRICQR